MMKLLRDWGLALLVGIAVFWVADRFGSGPSPTESTGDAAPDFTLANLTTGEDVTLSAFRGQTVVLNFWATWCGPCKAELPEFTSYAKAHPEVQVLGIVMPRDEGDKLAQIVDRFRIFYPVLVGTSKIDSLYRVRALPTTWVVRGDGTVASVQEGGISEEMLAEMVKRAGS